MKPVRFFITTTSILFIASAAAAAQKPKELMPIPDSTHYRSAPAVNTTLRPLLSSHVEVGRYHLEQEPILQDPEARRKFLVMLYETQRSLQSRQGESAKRYIERAINELDRSTGQYQEESAIPKNPTTAGSAKHMIAPGARAQGVEYIAFDLKDNKLRHLLVKTHQRIAKGQLHDATYHVRAIRDALSDVIANQQQLASRGEDIS